MRGPLGVMVCLCWPNILVCLLWADADQTGTYRVEPVPAELRQSWRLSDFYQKCLVARGLPILASARVNDYALKEAAYLVDKMLAGRDDLRQALIKHRIRVVVMAYNERTTDVPEHSDLKPPEYWDRRARGLGATRIRPAVSCGEENLLEYPGDPYRGENILIHEFAHTIHQIALREVDAAFDGRLAHAYSEAMKAQRWQNTYAATNRSEYWAEGVQSWFHCNRTNDRQHNHVNSREVLRQYDPPLARLLEEVFRNNTWVYTPPSQRTSPEHLRGFDRRLAPTFRWSDRFSQPHSKTSFFLSALAP
jgi:hypothetical protein